MNNITKSLFLTSIGKYKKRISCKIYIFPSSRDRLKNIIYYDDKNPMLLKTSAKTCLKV